MRHSFKFVQGSLLCLFLCLGMQARAHGGPAETEAGVETYLNILERMGQLHIENESEARSMTASTRISFFPFFNVGGQRVYVDNAFWEMADEMTRLFVREIKAACAECVLPPVEEIRRQAQDLVAKGWLETKARAIGEAVMYRYVGEFVGLGARYGTASGVAKVAGELMEDALLVVFKMPGAHFLCEAITFAIAYYSGATLSLIRSLMYSKYFNQGRIINLARYVVTSHYIKRSMRRMSITVPEFTMNEDLLKEFKENHPDRKMTYRVTGRHRAESFLRKLEAEIAGKKKRMEDLKTRTNLSQRQRDQLIRYEQQGIDTMITIKQKVFDGYRYKRFLLLKKRNSSQTLGPFAANTTPLLKGTNFWFFELKNEIFEPNVQREAAREFKASEQESVQRIMQEVLQDPVSREQLERLEGTQRELASQIFRTLDVIGDKNQKTSIRYFNFTFLEAFYGGLLPKLIGEVVNHVAEELPPEERRFRDVFQLKWKAGRMAYFTDVFVDYVRFSVFDTKNADPLRKYHLRDYALQVLKSHADFAKVGNAGTQEEMRTAAEYLNQQIRELDAGRFWREKAVKPMLLPFGRAPMCEALYL